MYPLDSDSRRNSDTGMTCLICMDPLLDAKTTDLVILLDACGHRFHFKCILKWLDMSDGCPICRKTVDVNDRKALRLVYSECRPAKKHQDSTQMDEKEVETNIDSNTGEYEHEGRSCELTSDEQHDVALDDDEQLDTALSVHVDINTPTETEETHLHRQQEATDPNSHVIMGNTMNVEDKYVTIDNLEFCDEHQKKGSFHNHCVNYKLEKDSTNWNLHNGMSSTGSVMRLNELPSVGSVRSLNVLPSGGHVRSLNELPSDGSVGSLNELPSGGHVRSLNELSFIGHERTLNELTSGGHVRSFMELPSSGSKRSCNELPSGGHVKSLNELASGVKYLIDTDNRSIKSCNYPVTHHNVISLASGTLQKAKESQTSLTSQNNLTPVVTSLHNNSNSPHIIDDHFEP